jgi:hypothetical protein
MKLKTIEIDGSVYAELQDGMPVYVHEDGREAPFDAPATVAKINERGREARDHRLAKAAAEDRLKLFDGIDPDKARKALEIARALDEKSLFVKDDVENMRQQYETERTAAVEERDAIKGRYAEDKLASAFASSPFIQTKMAVPVEMVAAAFGRHFSVDDAGRIIAKGPDGIPIFSKARPGELAEFEEALQVIVDAYPRRDSILKGSGSPRSMSRAHFQSLSAHDQMRFATTPGNSIYD